MLNLNKFLWTEFLNTEKQQNFLKKIWANDENVSSQFLLKTKNEFIFSLIDKN